MRLFELKVAIVVSLPIYKAAKGSSGRASEQGTTKLMWIDWGHENCSNVRKCDGRSEMPDGEEMMPRPNRHDGKVRYVLD